MDLRLTANPAKVPKSMSVKPLRVIVADDDVETASTLIAELKKDGISAELYPNGQEAVKAIKLKPPDVAVVDIMMPKLHGFEVCRMIKADPTTKIVKIMVLTARAYKPDQDKAMELGADDFVLKPFNPSDVVKRIRKLAG